MIRLISSLPPSAIGKLIKEERTRQRKSALKLANEVGCSMSYIYDIENFRRCCGRVLQLPVAPKLAKIMAVLGITVEQVDKYAAKMPLNRGEALDSHVGD